MASLVGNFKAAIAGAFPRVQPVAARAPQQPAGGATPDSLSLSAAITPAAFNAALSPNAAVSPSPVRPSATPAIMPTPAVTPVVNTPAPAPIVNPPSPVAPLPTPIVNTPYAPIPTPNAPSPAVPSFLAPALPSYTPAPAYTPVPSAIPAPAYQPLPQVAPAADVQSAYNAAVAQLQQLANPTPAAIVNPNLSNLPGLVAPPPPPPPILPPVPPPAPPLPPVAPSPVAVVPPPPPAPAPVAPTPAPAPQPASPQDAEKLKDLPAAELKRLGATDKQAFLEMLRPAAEAAERKYGVPAAVTLAQAALETGWGQHIIPGFNIFGVKGHGTAGMTTQTTREVYGGKSVTIKAGFAKYNNFYEGVEAHGKLFHNGYYDKAMNQYAQDHDPYKFANNITGTYATDPSYGQKLGQIMRQYHLA